MRYTSPQTHVSTFADKTASSVRFFPSNSTHGSTDGSQNTSPFEVTYSTRSGVVVALKSDDGSVRFTHAHHAGEGGAWENIAERGAGHLLMGTRDTTATSTLVARQRSACESFVQKATLAAAIHARKDVVLYRHGFTIQGIEPQKMSIADAADGANAEFQMNSSVQNASGGAGNEDDSATASEQIRKITQKKKKGSAAHTKSSSKGSSSQKEEEGSKKKGAQQNSEEENEAATIDPKQKLLKNFTFY